MINDIVFYAGMLLLTMIPVFLGIVILGESKKPHKSPKHKTSHRHAH